MRMPIVTATLFSSIPRSSLIALAIRGVAMLKVVAVPANRANTARKSMTRPAIPSVFSPSKGRHASEYFWRSLFRT